MCFLQYLHGPANSLHKDSLEDGSWIGLLPAHGVTESPGLASSHPASGLVRVTPPIGAWPHRLVGGVNGRGLVGHLDKGDKIA